MADGPQQLVGTYVLGIFQGVSEGDFPKLLIGTFVRDDGTIFQERLQFSPYDPRTGKATLPEGLKNGQRVAVRLRVDAKAYRDKTTGEPGVFVAKQALEVILPG